MTKYYNLENKISGDGPSLLSTTPITTMVDLISGSSISHRYKLEQDNVQVFLNKFIDISQMPFAQ